MSNSEVDVRVRAQDQCAELYLLNGQRVVVAAGLGSLKAQVSPGFYKVRQRIGDVEHNEVIEVGPDASKNVVDLRPLAFPSPIPLDGTTTSREFQQAALGFSDVTHSMGTGGTCFLMIRDPKWV